MRHLRCFMQRFFGDFSDSGDVFNAFSVDDREGCEILAAEYEMDGYEGSASVLFRKDGKLFEVYVSHCSCYGLEGCWQPEPVVEAELRERATRQGGPYWQAVIEILNA